jgi:hypothetical protein
LMRERIGTPRSGRTAGSERSLTWVRLLALLARGSIPRESARAGTRLADCLLVQGRSPGTSTRPHARRSMRGCRDGGDANLRVRSAVELPCTAPCAQRRADVASVRRSAPPAHWFPGPRCDPVRHPGCGEAVGRAHRPAAHGSIAPPSFAGVTADRTRR